jgi:LysR family transcriptional regulator, glycine cleavage system transcriptional activator
MTQTINAEFDSKTGLEQTRSVPLLDEQDSCMRRYRNVPPLQFLQGFEAASRLGSFSKAAEELGLSQSAVSHEMRLLEERVGQPLFLRVGRSVQLTDAGRVYQRSVRQALDDLDAAQQRLEPFRRASSVVIYAPRDFGRRWLVPKLGDLLAACPECQPWLDTSGAEVDFSSMEVSIGIVYAADPPQGLVAIRLAEDVRCPLAAKTLVSSGPLTDTEIAALPLIHDEGLPCWEDYFEQGGLARARLPGILDFSDSDAALAAAEAGLGVALASLALAQEALEKGSLVAVSARTLRSGKSWFAVTNAGELENAHTAAVWHWLEVAGIEPAASSAAPSA